MIELAMDCPIKLEFTNSPGSIANITRANFIANIRRRISNLKIITLITPSHNLLFGLFISNLEDLKK